mmetsp:Transcript_7132/g.23632  ORF Transcript_7132/g.23632 Transcript_7132/m.23632 type:complete len:436 (-) Transcript_7132:224-1531(-)
MRARVGEPSSRYMGLEVNLCGLGVSEREGTAAARLGARLASHEAAPHSDARERDAERGDAARGEELELVTARGAARADPPRESLAEHEARQHVADRGGDEGAGDGGDEAEVGQRDGDGGGEGEDAKGRRHARRRLPEDRREQRLRRITQTDVDEGVREDDLRADGDARELREAVGRRVVVEDEAVARASKGEEPGRHDDGGQGGGEREASGRQQREAAHLALLGGRCAGAGRELHVEVGRDKVAEEGGGEDRDEYEHLGREGESALEARPQRRRHRGVQRRAGPVGRHAEDHEGGGVEQSGDAERRREGERRERGQQRERQRAKGRQGGDGARPTREQRREAPRREDGGEGVADHHGVLDADREREQADEGRRHPRRLLAHRLGPGLAPGGGVGGGADAGHHREAVTGHGAGDGEESERRDKGRARGAEGGEADR